MLNPTIKNILVNSWNTFFNLVLFFKRLFHLLIDWIIIKTITPPYVKTIDQTIDKIINENCSISRYGDGELKLMSGRGISFQSYSPLLQKKLKEILTSNIEGHIVCIPDVFGNNKQYTELNAKEWKEHLIKYRGKWYRNLEKKKVYYNSLISRCYLCFQDQEKSGYYFSKIKKIWDGRDIVIIEGEFSRLGVGNDLFENTRSIQRVLCPNKHVFSEYSKILSYVNTLDKNNLFLIALGPTATVLAYEMHLEGFQAIDIGHIDVEYEWYLNGATKKIPIKNKFVNEVNRGNFEIDTINEKYWQEVIHKINLENKNKMEIC